MSNLELKTNIHTLVDGIQSEELLQTIYDFLKTKETSNPGEHWKSLTQKQKNEVLLAFEESELDYNLIDKESFLKQKK